MFKNSQAFKFVIILTIISFIFIIPVHRSQASYAKCDSAFLNSLDEQALRDMCTTYKFYREGISGDYDCLSVSKKDLVSTVDRALSLTCPTPSCNGLIAFLDVFLHQEFKNSCVADLKKYCQICDESSYGEGVTKKKSQQDLLSEMAASQATELTEEAPCELNILGSGTALEKIWNAIKGIVDGNISLGGIIYFSFVLVRGLLVATIKVLFWFLVPIIKINPNGTITGFGGFINFLNINQNSTSLTLVQQLWGDFRNLANIGIILGVIFTALATIFRSEKYSWKKMLPKLLIVALLINFSLIIADMFVDISNYLSLSIFNQFSGDSLATTVVDGTICPAVKAFFNEGGNYAYLRAASLGLILAGILLFQFVGLVSYVLTRIVTLVVCLITSPIALLAFAFPGGEKLFDFWRQRFQQAIVVLPILAFALYLSFRFIIVIINNLNANIQPNQSGALITTLAYAGFVIAFAQLVRYVAKFLGVEQVEKGFQLAKKAVTTAAMAGMAAVGGLAMSKVVESKAYQKVGQGLTHIPFLGGVGQKMMLEGEKNKAARITKYQKDYENISLAQLKELEKTPLPSPLDRPGYEKKIALTNQLAKMGELGDESVNFIKKYQKDRNLDQLTISRAIPQHFRIKDGVFGETGPTLKEKAQALGGIKENKILEFTQAKEVIEDMRDAIVKATKGTKDEKTEDEAFKEVIQELVRVFNPAQMNAFWRAISAKTLLEKGWGGPNGKIMEAVNQLEDTKKKFFEEMLPNCRALREISGVNPEENKESEVNKPKEIYIQQGNTISKRKIENK